MNEVVKYHNDLNTAVMRRWTKEEMNFFFAIIAKSRDKGCSQITFEKEQLKELVRYTERHSQRFLDIMKSLALKLNSLSYIEQDNKEMRVLSIFSKFTVSLEGEYVKVTVSEDFQYILNQIQANFTSYELAEFTQIRSTYAKTTYRLLKQWRTQGVKEFPLEEFRKLLDIPESYSQSDINKRVLKPVKEELSNYFINLTILPIKSKKRGNPITGYRFTWQAEQTGEWKDFSKKSKTGKPRKPIREEEIPDSVKEAEQKDIERKTKLQEEMFKRAVDLRSKSFEEKAQFYMEAREIDTYRMPDSANFLNNIALFMNFDTEKYLSLLLDSKFNTGDTHNDE